MTHDSVFLDSHERRPRQWWRSTIRAGAKIVVILAAAWGVLRTPIFDWLTLRQASAQDTPQRVMEVAPGVTLDDAGRKCRSNEIEIVELRVETDLNELVGHVFIHTARVDRGFYPTAEGLGATDYMNPLSPTAPGQLKDNVGHAYDRVRRYRAGPETVRLLEAAIEAHGSDAYQLGNWSGGRNCATWATDRLREVGLDAPPGDRPNVMGAYMQPACEAAR